MLSRGKATTRSGRAGLQSRLATAFAEALLPPTIGGDYQRRRSCAPMRRLLSAAARSMSAIFGVDVGKCECRSASGTLFKDGVGWELALYQRPISIPRV
jgi:hypothetical protein